MGACAGGLRARTGAEPAETIGLEPLFQGNAGLPANSALFETGHKVKSSAQAASPNRTDGARKVTDMSWISWYFCMEHRPRADVRLV